MSCDTSNIVTPLKAAAKPVKDLYIECMEDSMSVISKNGKTVGQTVRKSGYYMPITSRPKCWHDGECLWAGAVLQGILYLKGH